MDTKLLKERAKNVISKDHWLCVAVTLFMMLSISSTEGGYFNFSTTSGSSGAYIESNPSITIPFIGTVNFWNLFAGIGTFILVLNVLSIIAFSTFRCGGIRFYLKLRKDQPVGFTEIFQNFKDKTFLSIAKYSFLQTLFIVLWTMLFIIPGIIKTYEYWAINYILAVRPNIERKELFRLSKTVMDGHKLDVFWLSLTFFGWDLLNALTAGLLGIFWLNPYKEAAFVEFFSEIRLEAISLGKITPNDIPDYVSPEPPRQYGAPFMYNTDIPNPDNGMNP